MYIPYLPYLLYLPYISYLPYIPYLPYLPYLLYLPFGKVQQNLQKHRNIVAMRYLQLHLASDKSYVMLSYVYHEIGLIADRPKSSVAIFE